MRYSFAAAALFAASVVADKRDLCADGSVDDKGNWYCQPVTAITYTGMSGTGSYNKVTSMPAGGSCSSTPQGYSGSIAPLDEEVSMHFRGPMKLKQFAVYTPGSSSSKKSRRGAHARRHAHHAHAHKHHAREAAVGDMVTATINGVVQTWANEYTGAAATPAAGSNNVAAAAGNVVAAAAGSSSSDSDSSSSSSSASSSYGSSYSGEGWARQGYYNAEQGTSEGLVFLNHQGGSGSGTWDTTYGNSLSYASSDASSCASGPQVLEDCTVPSGEEFVIMTDKKCSGDSCGYSRPGTVAHHGFDGAEKAFLMEFQMPDDGQTAGANQWDPVNMPAIWMLNAQIPRTLQYGFAECSCWETGCGEFDIFEVLAPGDKRCKSTLHGNVAGGDSDYFVRPTDSTMKAAVVFKGNNMHIKVLDDNTTFDDVMSSSDIGDICSGTLTQTHTTSLFALAGAAGDSN